MSQESVKVVRDFIELFERRDMEALSQAAHEDFEFVSVFSAIDSGGATYRGPHAWEKYIQVMEETWEDWQIGDRDYFDGDDGVACVMRLVGKGRHSGAVVDRMIGIAYWIRDRKVWRMQSYLDPRDALGAVRASE